jgi:hypothetical protein
VEGGRPTPGLLMIGGGSDSSIEGWGTVSKGAGNKVGVGTAGVPTHGERLEVVHRQRSSAIWEDVRQPMLVVERWLWRERFAFDAGTCGRGGVAIFFRVIFGVGVV